MSDGDLDFRVVAATCTTEFNKGKLCEVAPFRPSSNDESTCLTNIIHACQMTTKSGSVIKIKLLKAL